MGYVKFTEQVGEISKTYEFGSYEDFKDWENKLSGVVVSADHLTLDGDIWIKNTGEYPPDNLDEYTRVEVKFKNGETSKGYVIDFFGWSKERIHLYSGEKDWTITHYRVVNK